MRAAIDLAPFELILSRPPVTLSTENPHAEVESGAETEKLRFLQHLRALRPLAAQQLRQAQERYMRNYDAHVRPKNQGIPKGDWAYVRKEVYVGINPKLLDQVDGPYQVVDNDDHELLLQMGDHLVRVSSDRITPAPTPQAHPSDDPQLGNTAETTRGDAALPPSEQPWIAKTLASRTLRRKTTLNTSSIGSSVCDRSPMGPTVTKYGGTVIVGKKIPGSRRGNLPSPMVRSYNRRVGLSRAN
jgi:hypothetical protein